MALLDRARSRAQPGSETWQGRDIEHGGAPTWFTGSYDAALDIVYWPTGNPSKEYDGVDRKGDNLYANSMLALDRKTGALKWYYQFTPHDLWDWDATQTSVLIDADWKGERRPLMLHASRNGFFYVFDRRDGKLLLTKPFVRNLTWASGIGADGRPIKLPNQEPSRAGTKVCPSQDGATNWFSPSYNPADRALLRADLREVQHLHDQRARAVGKRQVVSRRDRRRRRPIRSRSGSSRRSTSTPARSSGSCRRTAPAQSWGGTLTTASGLVIFGEDGGGLMAADAVTGTPLWSFQTNQTWRASPMTYMFDGKQYVAVAAGSTIIALAIQD